MGNFFDDFIGSSRRHVGDDQLLGLMDGELSMTQTRRVQKHLERCWNCRTRYDKLQTVIHGFVEYSGNVINPFLPPPPSGRDRFLTALDAELSSQSQSMRFHPIRLLRSLSESVMHPAFLTVVVVFVSAVLLTVVWNRASVHLPTPEELISRSVRSEQVAEHQTGVAYQKVELRFRKHQIERQIYRDLARQRAARPQKVSAAEASVKARLESAGVDWQNPLSPEDYQAWHGRVRILSDRVSRTAAGEWTLTTETADSTVREASLIVRASDFHPIGRQVVFRDSETVQIAELNYDELPWSAVNTSLFERSAGRESTGITSDVRASLYAPLPSHAELIGAELQAELALAQLHADAGEDVHVVRGRSGINVRGIVETDSRKQEIEQKLTQIALVRPELQSLEQIQKRVHGSASDGPTQIHAEDLQASPLDALFAARSIPPERSIQLSRTLIESSLVIEREANALSALEARYSANSDREMTESNRRLFSTLKEEHLSNLLQALGSEEAALSLYGDELGLRDVEAPDSLSNLAIRNQALCSELVSGAGKANRSGDVILHDLVRVSSQIRYTVNAIQKPPRP